MSSFFEDVGDFGKSLFTGRWTGGENSVGDVWNRDPLAVIAPVAAVAGGAALGAGALGGFGAEAAAGTAAEAGTFTDVGIVAPGGAYTPLEGSTLSAAEGSALGNSEFTTAFGMDTSGAAGGGNASIDQLMYGGAQGTPAGAPTSLAPAAPGGGAGGDSFLSKLGGDIMNHPMQALGVGAAGGLLGMSLLKGSPKGANVNNEQGLANTLRGETQELMATGKQLESYLLNGNLPPGMQSKVTQAVRATKAAAVSNAAKTGQNPDPNHNSQLQAALLDADMRGLQLATDMETALFKEGSNMVNQGITATGTTAKMYEWLTAQDDKTNEQIQKALMAFAGAAGGSRGGINIGGTKAA